MLKTKVIKKLVQQSSNPAGENRAGTAIKPVSPQKPGPNQKKANKRLENVN